jgi:hypothetical protein
MAVSAREWLSLMEAEYLSGFIPAGGSAVKFVIGEAGELAAVSARLAALAARLNLLYAPVDAAATKLHMIQDMFFALAREVDWDATAQRLVEGMFQRQGYEWPKPGEPVPIHQVAEANRVDVTLLRREFRQWLTGEIMHENRMAQDFRVAMTQLCLRRLAPPDDPQSGVVEPVREWLRGDLRTIGVLRQFQINAKITRHNARAMLRSLCCWLRMCGVPGIVLVLDIRQLARTGAAVGDGVKYSPAAVMDAFEVLRQMIDDAESFEGLFLAVLADEAFVDAEQNPKRSVQNYTALHMRIWPDVHALGRDNPLAPLIHLANEEAGREAA